jgi:hypothetical protein
MDLDRLRQRNETKNLHQTAARYFGPLLFQGPSRAGLPSPRFGQADDKRDDMSASVLRIGERPICHAVSSGLVRARAGLRGCGVFQVVKTAQSRGRTERLLPASVMHFVSMPQLSPLFYQDDQILYISRPPKLVRLAEA